MVSHRRAAARRVGPPSIAQCGGGGAARECRRRAGGTGAKQCAVAVVKAFLASCSILVVLVTKATFGLGKKAVLPAVRCASLCCIVVPLVLFRAIVLLTSRVHECDYTGVQASIYCTALGGALVGQQRTEPGLEPFAFRAARGGTCAATAAAVAPWRRGKAYTD